MYRLGTLTAVLLLLLLPGYPCEEMKVDLAQCEAACGMGIYYEGCKCFRQVSVCTCVCMHVECTKKATIALDR